MMIKKQNNFLLYSLVAAIVLVFGCLCCIVVLNIPTSTPITTDDSPPPNLFQTKVKYVLTGSANSALVTYYNETGGIEQANISIPWEKTINVDIGAPLSLVAQNSGSGSITCEIWMNGEKYKTSTSTAQYGVVTCTDFAH